MNNFKRGFKAFWILLSGDRPPKREKQAAEFAGFFLAASILYIIFPVLFGLLMAVVL